MNNDDSKCGIWKDVSVYECGECGYLSYFRYRRCPHCKIDMKNIDPEYKDYTPIDE